MPGHEDGGNHAVRAAAGATASAPTLAECLEGSDFIANAAIARDNGVVRVSFVERLEADLSLIRAFPPALRWFVKDGEDERFLHGQVERVFDAPALPADHREAFLRACLRRLEA
ncbi:MAG: hypothetical protein ABIR52_03745 [Casimicrobiaceae bacterium]